MSSASTDIRQSAESYGGIQSALGALADGITPDAETLKHCAVVAQAEAVRAAMFAQSLRAAAERLSIVSQLLLDEGGASS